MRELWDVCIMMVLSFNSFVFDFFWHMIIKKSFIVILSQQPWKRHKGQCVWGRRNSSKGGRKSEQKFRWRNVLMGWDWVQNELCSVHRNEAVTEQQMQVVSAMVDKLEEPVYDHRARIKERSRPLWKCNDNQPISVFWEIGGVKAHCLIDSRCKGIMISPSFIREAKIEPFPLDKPIGIQLAVTGSKSIINYGVNATIKYNEKNWKNILI